MQYLSLLALVASVFAFGDVNWMALGKSGTKTMYTSKESCEQKEKHDCYDMGDPAKGTFKDPRFHSVTTADEDDQSKPIWKPKYNVVACGSPSECKSKQVELGGNAHCNTGDQIFYSKNSLMPGYSIFCSRVTGYEQKSVTRAREVPLLKAQVESDDVSKKAEKDAVQKVMKDQQFGKVLVATLVARNKAKNLTSKQKKDLAVAYQTVQQLLLAGSLKAAKDEVSASTPDGTLVTQADKDALLAALTAYLGS